MVVLFRRLSPGWLPGGVWGARWEVRGEAEMPVSGLGVLPTEDTSAATSLRRGLLTVVCTGVSEDPSSQAGGWPRSLNSDGFIPKAFFC